MPKYRLTLSPVLLALIGLVCWGTLHATAASDRQMGADDLAVVSGTCVPNTSSIINPRPPVFSGMAADSDAQMLFEVWREPCTDGSGQVVLLLKVTQMSGSPLVCNVDFTVIQGGQQYTSVILFQTSGGRLDSFCAYVLVPTITLILEQFPSPLQFDELQTFALIHDGGSAGLSRLEVGAAELPPPPPPPPPPPLPLPPPLSRELTLSLNQTAFRTGETLRVELDAQNPGPAFTADVYVGVLLPDGETVFFITRRSPLQSVVTRLDADPRTFPPLLASVQLPQGLDITLTDFLVYAFGGGELAGTYTAFAFFTPPGAFTDGRMDPDDLVEIDVRPFVFSP